MTGTIPMNRIARLFRTPARRKAGARRLGLRPGLEGLESRQLLSGGVSYSDHVNFDGLTFAVVGPAGTGPQFQAGTDDGQPVQSVVGATVAVGLEVSASDFARSFKPVLYLNGDPQAGPTSSTDFVKLFTATAATATTTGNEHGEFGTDGDIEGYYAGGYHAIVGSGSQNTLYAGELTAPGGDSISNAGGVTVGVGGIALTASNLGIDTASTCADGAGRLLDQCAPDQLDRRGRHRRREHQHRRPDRHQLARRLDRHGFRPDGLPRRLPALGRDARGGLQQLEPADRPRRLDHHRGGWPARQGEWPAARRDPRRAEREQHDQDPGDRHRRRQPGEPQRLGQLDGHLHRGGDDVRAESLGVSYQAGPAATLALDGRAKLSWGSGNTAGSIDVQLGNASQGIDGLVIEDGILETLNGSIDANFSFMGLGVQVNQLTVAYQRSTQDLTIFGGAKVSNQDPDGASFKSLSAQLGTSAASPGIEVHDGTLQGVDVSVSGAFALYGVELAAEDLSVVYDASASQLALSGRVDVSLTNAIQGTVALPNGGITINTQTGAFQVNGLDLAFNASFAVVPARRGHPVPVERRQLLIPRRSGGHPAGDQRRRRWRDAHDRQRPAPGHQRWA